MNKKAQLTGSDRRQALSVLESEYQKAKQQRSIFVHSPNVEGALEASTLMVEKAAALYDLDPTQKRLRNLQYARYYEAVSGCIVAQLSADFDKAQKYAQAAAQGARHFRGSSRFFPNVFFDETELGSHGVYLEAVKSFREGHFQEAADHFEKWLMLNHLREGTGDAHYDSNQFHQQLCSALNAIDQRLECSAQWEELEKALQSPYRNIYRTTRALWDHIEPLKAAANLGEDRFPDVRSMIELFLRKACDDWQLLCTSAPIQGKDRWAGLEEPVRLPEFIDVFHTLYQVGDEVGEIWRYLLFQSLRNSLTLKADYESRLRPHISSVDSDEKQLVVKASFEIERLGDTALIHYIHDLISARIQSHFTISDASVPTDLTIYDACVPMWFEARKAIYSADRSEAEEKCHHFYAKLRSLPHVIRITNCDAIPFMGECIDAVSGRHYKVEVQRIWHHSPRKLTLEMEHPVPTGSYAYLRPRWNRSLKRGYRIRNPLDNPLPTRMPEWMILFEQWASGQGPVKAEAFLKWCQQIDPLWLSVALRLLSKLVFYDESKIRELWKRLYQSKLPANVKGDKTLYVGLGRAGKSGGFQLYWLEQALCDLPKSERSFEFNNAFRTEDSLREEHGNIDSIVFVDDFIGTGEQAEDFTESVLKRYEWVGRRRCSLFLCA